MKACGAQQSMDGKGCWRDNVFVERLWRSVKYEEVYLKAYDSVQRCAARAGALLRVLQRAPVAQSHDGQTPGMVYFNSLPPVQAAVMG